MSGDGGDGVRAEVRVAVDAAAVAWLRSVAELTNPCPACGALMGLVQMRGMGSVVMHVAQSRCAWFRAATAAEALRAVAAN